MSLTDIVEHRLLYTSPYKEGYDACIDGAMYEQNPYLSDSLESRHWADGYCDAETLECDDVERD